MRLPAVLITKAMVVGLVILTSPGVSAEVVMIEATRDNTLYQDAEGDVSNGAGSYIFVGRTQNGNVRRAVLAFDDLSAIPAGSVITAARLHLALSRENSGSTEISVSRVLADWGEGSSDADSQEGRGATATVNDATWIHRFYDTSNWATPGGDFSSTASAQFTADSIGSYVVESTPELIADVQGWLDNPGSNNGWILRGGESARSTKRFNSREFSQAESRPMLEIEFTPGEISDWTGPWFDPTLDGEGYLIYKTEAGWFIYFFGYTADGEQLWLISDIQDVGNPVLEQQYTFTMSVGSGGTFNNPLPSTELQEWGSLNVVFTSCTSGLFSLESQDLLKISEVVKIIGVEGTQCQAE